jgi:hypothetical protein
MATTAAAATRAWRQWALAISAAPRRRIAALVASACRGELAQERLQFTLMLHGHAGQQSLALGEQVDFHDALVVASGTAFEQLERLATIDQSDDAVMVRLQPLGQLADRGPRPTWEAHHVQQQLVLQRREPVPLAQQLADAQEVAEAVAEVGQPLVVVLANALGGWRGHFRHGIRVVIYITS